MLQSLWKTVCQVINMLNINLPYDLAILNQGIHLRERETRICPSKDLRTYFLRRIIYNIQKVETRQMSMNL